MDFEITEEQRIMTESLRNFITRKYSREYFREAEGNRSFPTEFYKDLGELGYLGLPISEEFGGAGGTTVDVILFLEELTRLCGASAMMYILTACFGGRTISKFGTEAQKKEILPALMRGDFFFAMAMTEPGGGTDVMAMKTRAELDGTGSFFVVNGQKTWISGADMANYLLLVAKSDPSPKRKVDGFSLLLVDPKMPGVEIRPIDFRKESTISACEIFFEDAKVPKENLVGPLHKGFKCLFPTLNDERLQAAAMCVGAAQAAFEDALEYAKERQAFGKPIGQFQAIQHKLADCATEIDVPRTFLHKAAWLEATDKPAAVPAVMAKLFASEMLVRVQERCRTVFGGYQFSKEYDVYRHTDMRYTHAPISSEMCRNFIGEQIGLPKSY